MLDRNLLRTNPELVKAGHRKKQMEGPVDAFLETYSALHALKLELEQQRAEQNRISKSIGQLMAQGKKEEAEEAKAQTTKLKEALAAGEPREKQLEQVLRELELRIPNLPHESVPEGNGPDDNVNVREWGEKPNFKEAPKPHWEIAEGLRLLDFERASKISGSGFALYTGMGAKLQRALINFMADHQSQVNGYREIYPPFMVNSASLYGTGQLPKFEEDLYKADDDLYLIPTAEVPITNIYRDEILDGNDLTLKMAGFSGCFRKEAGAAGKDTRGIQRMHQFDKVECVKLTKPEDSYNELETLTQDAESVLQKLGMHYRVMLMCGPEMSFSNAKQYDIEIWAPGVGKYLEISSCSNFEAFQARRANIRFRRAQGEKPEFVHVLNGSGLACPRLFASILEVFQQPDGSVVLPEALRPYVGASELKLA